eukprot:scaffold20820_cov65-Phaeocystis_antarctica.AAC.3
MCIRPARQQRLAAIGHVCQLEIEPVLGTRRCRDVVRPVVSQGHVHERASDLSLDRVVRLAHAALAHEQGAVGVRRRPDCVWHSAEDVVATVRIAALQGGAQRVQVRRWLVVRARLVARKRLRPKVLPGPACTGVVLLRAVGAAVSVEQPHVGRGSRVGIGLFEDVPRVSAAAPAVAARCAAGTVLVARAAAAAAALALVGMAAARVARVTAAAGWAAAAAAARASAC